MKLKNLICVILVLLLTCGAALAETSMYDVIDNYEGKWVSERLTLMIESLDDVVYATIFWPDSPTEIARWDYADLTYDEVADELNTLETGVMTYTIYDEDGEVVSEEERYSDGAASFRLTEDGGLIWTDYKETPGENEIVFERAVELTLGDYLDLEVENSLTNYNSEQFVYGYIMDGVPTRVTAAMTQEIYDAIWALDYDDDYERNFRALVDDLPVLSVEDLSDEALPREELDAFVGQKGEALWEFGFEDNGYMYSEEETELYLDYGPFEYTAEFEEIIEDEEADPYELMKGMTVKEINVSGLSYEGLAPEGGEALNLDLFSWLFGGLYSSVPQAVESPEWVKALPEAQDENNQQLFVVAGLGMDLTTATVSMHQRDEEGNWMQILSTPGFVGKNGLCLDEDHAEGCGQTPIGVYRFNKAFGIAENPGCALDYIKVDENTYWSGDPERQYNQMVDIREVPDLAMDDSEHIVDYAYEYQYCLNISFNEDGTAGRGSAIFLHCFGQKKPYTGGCVAIPENIMKLVMMAVNEDCVVVIDTLENLGGSF